MHLAGRDDYDLSMIARFWNNPISTHGRDRVLSGHLFVGLTNNLAKSEIKK
jgi:hypothetical protein